MDYLSSDVESSGIVRMSASSFNFVSSFRVIDDREMASGFWCLILALCTTLNSNSDNLERRWESFPILSLGFRIWHNLSWSAQTASQDTSTYRLNGGKPIRQPECHHRLVCIPTQPCLAIRTIIQRALHLCLVGVESGPICSAYRMHRCPTHIVRLVLVGKAAVVILEFWRLLEMCFGRSLNIRV